MWNQEYSVRTQIKEYLVSIKIQINHLINNAKNTIMGD
jgi:hypothetical protein